MADSHTSPEELRAEIETLRARVAELEKAQAERDPAKIHVSGIDIQWNVAAGTCTFEALPVAMLWIDTTLAGVMSGVQSMVGAARFVLALQSEGRKSVDADWRVISQFPDFREGFEAIANIAAVAGWGDWKLISLDENEKTCRFRVRNSWEGRYQQALGVSWGSGMLAGKMAGYCSRLFGTNCWAEQVAFIARGDEFDEFVVSPSERSVENEIEKLLATDETTRADMAVALQKLQTEVEERLRAEESLKMFQYSIDQARDAIFWMTYDAGFTYVNEQACRSLGYTREELLGLNLWDIDPVYPKERWESTWEEWRTDHRGGGESLETLHRRKDGSVFPVEISSRHLWFGDYELHVAVARDITERKQLERDLRLTQFGVDQASIGIMGTGPDGKILSANRHFCHMLGYTVEELCDLHTYDLDPHYPQEKWQEHRNYIRVHGSDTFQSEHRRKDGTTVPVEVTATFLPFEDSEYAFSFVRDITARKQAEEAMRASEEKYRSLFEHANDSIFIIDPATRRFLDVNANAASRLGYTRDELLQMGIDDLYPPGASERIAAIVQELQETGSVVFEQIHLRKDGSEMPVEISSRVIEYGGQQVFQSFVRDITERKRAEEELRKSEEKYRDLVENMNDVVYSLDEKGVLTYISPSVEMLLGYPPSEVVGRPFTDFVHPEDLQRIRESYKQILSGHSAEPNEYRILARTAGFRWLRTSSRPIVVEDRVVGVRGVLADITERKLTEEALRESEKKYRSVADNIGVGIVVIQDGQRVYYNSRSRQLVGYSEQEYREIDFIELVHPDDRQVALDGIRRQLAGEVPETEWVEVRVLSKSGEVKWTESGGVVIDWEGKPAVQAFLHDITERKRAEEALRESEERFRTIFDSAPIGINILDAEERPIRANRVLQDMLGYTQAELQGMVYADYTHPDDVEMSRSLAGELREGKIPTARFQKRYRRKDGGLVWVNMAVSAVINPDGEFQYFIAMIEDITERKKAEEALRESEERFSTVFRHSPMGIAIFRAADGRFVEANDTFLQATGYNREEIIGRTAVELQLYARPEERASLMQLLQERHSLETHEFAARTKSGEVRFALSATREISLGGEMHHLTMIVDVTERRRAEEALQRRARELAALQATVLDITTRQDLSTLLQTIVERAVALLEARGGGGLYLCDPDREEVRCVVSYNTPHDYTGTVLKYGEGAAGTVAQTGEPLLIDDYRTWSGRADAYEEDEPFTSVLSAPMVWQGQATGVIHVLDDVERRQFTQADVELLMLFANHAAIAVENTRLYEAARSHSRYLETLQQVNATLRSTLPLSQVLEMIVQGASKVLNSVGSVFALPDAAGERLEVRAVWGGRFLDAVANVTGTAVASFSLPLTAGDNPMVQAYLSGELQTYSRQPELSVIGVEPPISRRMASLIEKTMGFRSTAFVPLVAGEETLGVLAVFSPREQFSEEERAMLLGLADQAGLAIQNAKLYETIQRHAEELEREVVERARAEKQARASLQEKEILLKEVHHRVKNNLQIITSLLSLQSDQARDEQLETYLRESQRRVWAMALIHEKLYRSENLAEIDFGDYIGVLANNLVETASTDPGDIHLQIDVESIPLGLDAAIACGLIVNELLSNALTHAFPAGAPGELRVSLRKESGSIKLVVADDGVGLPEDLDLQTTETLGLKLVNSLVQQLDGVVQVNHDGGTEFVILFSEPAPTQKLPPN